MANTNNHQYDDIINLPHHVSQTRPRMSMTDRAAQFSPFAALAGFDAAIREMGRLTEQRIELTEDSREELDRRQQLLVEHLSEHPEVSVTYFVSDERKSGGAYVTVSDGVKKIDRYQRLLVLNDDLWIPLNEIIVLDSEIIDSSNHTEHPPVRQSFKGTSLQPRNARNRFSSALLRRQRQNIGRIPPDRPCAAGASAPGRWDI